MSDIEAERIIRDGKRDIAKYQTQINAMESVSNGTEPAPEKPAGTLKRLLEGFNTMMATAKQERETYYGDKIRDYASGRMVSGAKVETKEPDYATIISEMEQGLRGAGIDMQNPAWNVVAALKQKYRVE